MEFPRVLLRETKAERKGINWNNFLLMKHNDFIFTKFLRLFLSIYRLFPDNCQRFFYKETDLWTDKRKRLRKIDEDKEKDARMSNFGKRNSVRLASAREQRKMAPV